MTDSTATGPLTIAGQAFTVNRPFAEGHVCTAGEASALNISFAEAIRNLFSDKVKAGKEVDGTPVTQADVDATMATYALGIRSGNGGGGRTSDPVEAQAMEIARGKVREAIRKQGFSLKDTKDSEITRLAKEALGKHPEWRDIAKQMVAAAQSLAAIELGSAPAVTPSKPKKGANATA